MCLMRGTSEIQKALGAAQLHNETYVNLHLLSTHHGKASQSLYSFDKNK